MVHKSLCNC